LIREVPTGKNRPQYMPLPTADQFQAAREIRTTMTAWIAAEELIDSVFQKYRQNGDRFLVLLKVRLINQLYRTSIRAEDQVAQRIAEQDPALSILLAQGNADAVQLIAECGIGRKEQVFASKFAHFHEPAHFAMGDKYVDIALMALGLRQWNRTRYKNAVSQGYQQFRQQITEIARSGQVSLRDADLYLWLRGQKESAAIAGTDELSGSVKWSLQHYPAFWNRL
jgi:hypothetical protein